MHYMYVLSIMERQIIDAIVGYIDCEQQQAITPIVR